MGDELLVGAIRLPDGTPIRGRGRREPVPPAPLPDYGLYLGRPGGGPGWLARKPPWLPRWRATWFPQWRADWVDWPDFRTPRDSEVAAALIRHAYGLARDGQRVEIACHGGTGRTGTVIACMAILAGHPAAEAVGWTRRHYRPHAVETRGQQRWVAWFAANRPAG